MSYTEAQIDRIVESKEEELSKIAGEYDVASIKVDEVASLILMGKTDNQIKEHLGFNVESVREYPNVKAEGELAILRKHKDIIGKVKAILEII